MVNKRGFIRIVEATIAALLILSSVLVLSYQRDSGVKPDFGEMLPSVLDEISRDVVLRGEITSGIDEEATESKVEILMREKVDNPSFEYAVEICDLDGPCFLDPYPEGIDEDIFSSERVISTAIDSSEFSPRRVKVFLWQKTSGS